MKPIVLKADTALLRALVESDPELKLQISSAVLKNVSDDICKAAVLEKLKAQLDQLANFAAGWNRNSTMMNPFHNSPLHDLLKKLINAQIEQATEELIIQSVTPVIQKVFEAKLPEFQKQLDEMIEASLSPEHLKKRLEAKLAALAP